MSAGRAWPPLPEIAAEVRSGRQTALVLTEQVLADIAARDAGYGCFTRVLAAEARQQAATVDRQVAQGVDPGPLAGVPFAVKDLFDVAGLPTTAGAKLRLSAPPAARDAEVVRRLKAAGAVLVGTLNMDEFAYGFVTNNAHFGTTRNPHDRLRLAGGSSGGSAAAVAAGLVPFSLGSDTNGSIRVPAALCGLWGIRPGDGLISTTGVFPLAASLDTVGPFARCSADLALLYRLMVHRPPLPAAAAAPRLARLGGWFARNVAADVAAAVDQVAAALGVTAEADWPSAEAARSAGFLITAAEAGALHAPSLRHHALDYDPATRDRLLAGSLLPAAALLPAQRVRGWYRAAVTALWDEVDIVLAPTTPVVAPRIDDPTLLLDGQPVPARANLGIFAQPISLAGITAVSAPVARPDGLPVGVQFAVAPGREALLFQLLERLERQGVLATTPLAQN